MPNVQEVFRKLQDSTKSKLKALRGTSRGTIVALLRPKAAPAPVRHAPVLLILATRQATRLPGLLGDRLPCRRD